jgi:hypothetical protein
MKTKEELAIEHARTEVSESLFAEFHLAKSSFIAGYDARAKEVEELKANLEKAVEALETISCSSDEEMGNELFWHQISHDLCAETLAYNIRRVREALKAIKEE